jgi:hypothetical protein
VPGDRHVDFEFVEPVVPRLQSVGRVQVECNLYDAEAVTRAQQLVAERT